MSNKSNGNALEREVCEILAALGFWAHNMASRAEGQPADIIAVKDGQAFLIDCKDCKRDVFEFRRIEENQRHAMQFWASRGNDIYNCFFAVRTSRGIYLVSMAYIQTMEKARKNSMNADEIEQAAAFTLGLYY